MTPRNNVSSAIGKSINSANTADIPNEKDKLCTDKNSFLKLIVSLLTSKQ